MKQEKLSLRYSLELSLSDHESILDENKIKIIEHNIIVDAELLEIRNKFISDN